MPRIAACLCITIAFLTAANALTLSDRDRLKKQAQRLCYDDVQKLCADAVPDEAKIQACMQAHVAQLSPACRKVTEAAR